MRKAALTLIVFFALSSPAYADITLRTPTGMSTQKNYPMLRWNTTNEDTHRWLRISTSRSTNATGMLNSNIKLMAEADEISDYSVTGNTENWGWLYYTRNPMFPGKYYWQVSAWEAITLDEYWSGIRSFTVRKWAAKNIGRSQTGINSVSETLEWGTNARKTPYRLNWKFEGKSACIRRGLLRRDMASSEPIVTATYNCPFGMEVCDGRRGTYILTVGSKATTGRVHRIVRRNYVPPCAS